jgi:hypothetical protein
MAGPVGPRAACCRSISCCPLHSGRRRPLPMGSSLRVPGTTIPYHAYLCRFRGDDGHRLLQARSPSPSPYRRLCLDPGFSSISVASSSPHSEPAQSRSIYGRLIPSVKRLMRFRDFTFLKISRQQSRITHGLGKLEVYLAVVLYVKDIVLQVVHIFMKTYNL